MLHFVFVTFTFRDNAQSERRHESWMYLEWTSQMSTGDEFHCWETAVWLFDPIFRSFRYARVARPAAGFAPTRKRNCETSSCNVSRCLENYVTRICISMVDYRKNYIYVCVPRLLVNRGMTLRVKMCRKLRVIFAQRGVSQKFLFIYFFLTSKYKKNLSLNFCLIWNIITIIY